jgi:hypothetical protein
MVFMNGAVVSASMQRHSTVDTSTTCAELTEAFRCGSDVMGFRNLHKEFGIDDGTPTVLYQDCQPAIKVAEGKGSLAARTKFMDIRVFKIREWICDKEIKLQYCKTLSMVPGSHANQPGSRVEGRRRARRAGSRETRRLGGSRQAASKGRLKGPQ